MPNHTKIWINFFLTAQKYCFFLTYTSFFGYFICIYAIFVVPLQSFLIKKGMTILCVETSTAVCSAALWSEGKLIQQYINREGSNHARLLPLYMEQLMHDVRSAGLTIDAVALSEGPGSYTGLRIGTSTAKGLCYGLNVPLIPVPTLRVLCEAWRSKEQGAQSTELLCPMIDARRMEVYAAIFDSRQLNEKENPARAVVVENEESLLSGEGIAADGERTVYYFGDGAAKCQNVLPNERWHYVPDIIPEAQYVGKIAETMPQVTDIAYYEPFYLKEFIAAQSHVKGLN
jgi:tRNA threonylcarbamoyladenosine biosynthesis protein TsaB